MRMVRTAKSMKGLKGCLSLGRKSKASFLETKAEGEVRSAPRTIFYFERSLSSASPIDAGVEWATRTTNLYLVARNLSEFACQDRDHFHRSGNYR